MPCPEPLDCSHIADYVYDRRPLYDLHGCPNVLVRDVSILLCVAASLCCACSVSEGTIT